MEMEGRWKHLHSSSFIFEIEEKLVEIKGSKCRTIKTTFITLFVVINNLFDNFIITIFAKKERDN